MAKKVRALDARLVRQRREIVAYLRERAKHYPVLHVIAEEVAKGRYAVPNRQ